MWVKKSSYLGAVMVLLKKFLSKKNRFQSKIFWIWMYDIIDRARLFSYFYDIKSVHSNCNKFHALFICRIKLRRRNLISNRSAAAHQFKCWFTATTSSLDHHTKHIVVYGVAICTTERVQRKNKSRPKFKIFVKPDRICPLVLFK